MDEEIIHLKNFGKKKKWTKEKTFVVEGVDSGSGGKPINRLNHFILS